MSDAITTELIRHNFLSTTEEMARNLCRSSYNTIVYEIHDYGIGLHDAAGDVVADVPGIAVFTRGNDYGIKKAVEFRGIEAMRDGDVFILNYPYWSSAHTLDVLVFAPAVVDGAVIGYASCRVHVLDLQQKDPGYVLDSTDMYQEGIFFRSARLYARGELAEDVFDIIRVNSRLPERTIGDIQAQVSACVTGVARLKELAARFGTDTLTESMHAIQDHGAALARAGLARLPKGTWSAEDVVDNDGVDLDRPITLSATVTVTDDEMIIDWTGSEKNVRGPINLPRGLTEAFCSLIFKSLTTPDTPVVAGNFRGLRVITEPGSVMDAIPPQPTFTAWTALLGGEVVLKALAEGMPDLVPASSGGDVCSVMGLGHHPGTGADWLEATNDAVGFGGHAGGDGEDGIMHMSEPGCRNNPIEVLETKAPLLIDSYGYRADSGGAGEYRGGAGVSRVYRFLEPAEAICMVYKTISPPWGIGGGGTGDPNHILLNAGGAAEKRTAAGHYRLQPQETLTNNTGGGGGFGDPLRRDVAAVRSDVLNGFVSVGAAKEQYGVILDPETFDIDAAATSRLRS